MQLTSAETEHHDAGVVEEELVRLDAVRQDPPARADFRGVMPQTNGDQDTW